MAKVKTSLKYGLDSALRLTIEYCDRKATKAEKKGDKALTDKWDKAGIVLDKALQEICKLELPK